MEEGAIARSGISPTPADANSLCAHIFPETSFTTCRGPMTNHPPPDRGFTQMSFL